jgi:hypothetical protein
MNASGIVVACKVAVSVKIVLHRAWLSLAGTLSFGCGVDKLKVKA